MHVIIIVAIVAAITTLFAFLILVRLSGRAGVSLYSKGAHCCCTYYRDQYGGIYSKGCDPSIPRTSCFHPFEWQNKDTCIADLADLADLA